MSKNDSEEVIEGTELEIGITKINLKGTVVPLTQVLEEIAPQGERVKKQDIIGWPIVIVGVRPFEGKYGEAAFVIFTNENGELFNTVLGNKVLLPKLVAVKDHLPVSCIIVKKDREGGNSYYDFE